MNTLRRFFVVCLAVQLVAALGCMGCSTRESKMSASPAPPKTFSAFTALNGGFSEAIAPGSPLVTLSRGAGATWWEGDAPVTAELPPGTPVEGARWSPGGKELQVGLGTLELARRAWRAAPALAQWSQLGPRGEQPVREVAWGPDTRHLALLLESRDQRGEQVREVVVVSASDGKARARRQVQGAATLAASDDRVLVAGTTVVLLDLDANVVAEPSPVPASVFRVRESAGKFAVVGANGTVALINGADGAVLATWEINANDAIPIPHGMIAVDLEGRVRVGCLDGGQLRPVAEAATTVLNAVLQLVGDRLAVAGAGPTPVHVASFASPCR